MPSRMRLPVLLLGLILLAPAPIAAAPLDGEQNRLGQAREESGLAGSPQPTHQLPAGELHVTPELLAASGGTLRFSVELARPVSGGVLSIALPRRWLTEPAGGLPRTLAPRLVKGARGRAELGPGRRRVELSFQGGEAGDVATVELRDVGIPAGSYRLPFAWRETGAPASHGTARVVLYAPVREGSEPERLADPGVAENASSDATEESETFIATTTGNSNRVVVGSNWQAASMSAWVSGDAGHSWLQRTMPQSIDAPGEALPESGNVCCDPAFAADELGNVWFGGLALANGAGVPSRIVVNRIAAGTSSFQPLTVGLPVRTAGTQDKPMMTIDDSASSPTRGRLYVIWDEPASGGVNLVISQCDTRPGGISDAARCDSADNWSTPASVTPAPGSYIYGDVAVGPDGKVYVTWWDYSSTNAIRGDVCNPAIQACAAATGWGTPQTIAVLDSTGGAPVPFACPILAQPGGRAAPNPQVEADHSGGAENGRVYVTWSDLRPGSGATRCAVKVNGDGTTPASTHLTWDSFVASAGGGALPGGSVASTSAGTRLYADSSEGTASTNSDEWFPWLAVDQTTGQAWADLYSTRDDATRKKTNFYARSVTPSGGGHNLGTLTKVSAAQSDYSAGQCCRFGNDYGDYEGLDATGGIAYPVWTDNSGGDGEAFTFVSQLSGTAPSATTGAASSVTQSSATLNGTVNPRGQATTYHFEYGTTTAYGAQTSELPAGSGSSNAAVTANVSALSPGTPYHFRLVAQNATGTATGLDAGFTTSAAPNAPPGVSTGAAGSVTDSSATVQGTVNPNGLATSFHFDYGVDAGPGVFTDSTPSTGAGSGSSPVGVSAALSGLSPGTTYRYRLAAANSAGPATGSELTFKTTTPAPPPTPSPTPTPIQMPFDSTPPLVTISASAVRMTRGGLARVLASCPATEPDGYCSGALSLETAKRVLFRGHRRKLSLGQGDFVIGAGRSTTVAIPLSRAKRRLVFGLGKLAVLATASVHDLAANVGTSQQRLVLKAP